MRLPGFVGIGAPKAGTTTLFEMLRQHPDVFLPAAKELHFFDDDANYRRGPEWYAQFFAGASGGQSLGEITPAYASYDYVPERIAAVLGSEVRLIMILRHPVDRAYSEYLHNHRRGLVDIPFEQAIEREFAQPQLHPFARRRYSFISRGRYAQQLRNFLRCFAPAQLLVLIFEEEIQTNLADTTRRLQQFLEVEQRDLPLEVHANRAVLPRSRHLERLVFSRNPIRRAARSLLPSPRLRTAIRRQLRGLNQRAVAPPALGTEQRAALMQQYFPEEIAELTALLDRSLACWEEGPQPIDTPT